MAKWGVISRLQTYLECFPGSLRRKQITLNSRWIICFPWRCKLYCPRSFHTQCLWFLHQAGSDVTVVSKWVKQWQGWFDLYNKSWNNAPLIERLHKAKMKFGRVNQEDNLICTMEQLCWLFWKHETLRVINCKSFSVILLFHFNPKYLSKNHSQTTNFYCHDKLSSQEPLLPLGWPRGFLSCTGYTSWFPTRF